MRKGGREVTVIGSRSRQVFSYHNELGSHGPVSGYTHSTISVPTLPSKIHANGIFKLCKLLLSPLSNLQPPHRLYPKHPFITILITLIQTNIISFYRNTKFPIPIPALLIARTTFSVNIYSQKKFLKPMSFALFKVNNWFKSIVRETFFCGVLSPDGGHVDVLRKFH